MITNLIIVTKEVICFKFNYFYKHLVKLKQYLDQGFRNMGHIITMFLKI